MTTPPDVVLEPPPAACPYCGGVPAQACDSMGGRYPCESDEAQAFAIQSADAPMLTVRLGGDG